MDEKEVQESKVEYTVETLINHQGREYGIRYLITGPVGVPLNDLHQQLIKDVIGEDKYYSSYVDANGDIWDQIIIADARLQLKSCPFCGKNTNLTFWVFFKNDYRVHCQYCEIFGPHGGDRMSAAESWNKRS